MGRKNAKKTRQKKTKKEAFLSWLSNKTGLKPLEINHLLGHVFENLFSEMERELGQVSTKELNPKYVQIFLLKP